MSWISIKKQLPEHGLKVRYRMKKRIHLFKSIYVEDMGVYLNGEFCTFDPKYIYPITHWKPF